MVITDPYEAYQFLYYHPRAIEENEAHPIVDFEPIPDEIVQNVDRWEEFLNRERTPEEVIIGHEHRWRGWWTGQFIHNLSIMYVKVNPTTNHIDDDATLNTLTRVWLETGPAYWSEEEGKYRENMHDPSLDVGGDTFDLALINLANKVLERYGDYER